MEITVPLKDYIDALIGIKEFAILDETGASRIRNIAGHDTLCTIEEACNKLFILKHYNPNSGEAQLARRRSLIKEYLDKVANKYGEDMRKIVEMQCTKMSDEQINKRMQMI